MNSNTDFKVAFFVYPSAFQAKGGGEVQLMKTKEALESLGVSVKLFDTWTDQLQDFDILHVFGSVKDALPMMEVAKARGVQVVLSTICWYSWKSSLGGNDTLKEKSLSVLRHAAKEFLPFIPSRRKKMMQISDALLPNSESEKKQLQEYFQVRSHRIHVIPNGVDTKFQSATPDKFIEKYGFKDFVLCVGRIEPRKNQLNMVKAMRDLDRPVVFIGDPVDRYQDYYKACLREKTDNIHFLGGFEPNSELLLSAFAAADVFLLASWLETPGLAALEAALTGTKVVITQEGATREYFDKFAYYVAPDDVQDIREKTIEALKAEGSSLLKEHILNHFTWSRVGEKTLDVYREVLKK